MPALPVQIPSLKKEVCVEIEVLFSEGSVVLAKKTFKVLLNVLSGPKVNFALEEAHLPKEFPTNENVAPTKQCQVPSEKKLKGTLQSGKPVSLPQNIINPKVDSSKEATTTTAQH